MIDLRTDTITKPTPAMRAAMTAAEVGDDVFGEDPTVRRLEERVADLLGKEAALFVPSGTMGNQMGVRIHCQSGDEFLCEAACHIYNFEQAASAQFFGVAAHPIPTTDGVLTLDHLQDAPRDEDVHEARTRLLTLENTHNRGAGRVLPYDNVAQLCRWASEKGLARHLDGARLWNAVVASGIAARQWAQHFDTASVCFSKGLGAPVGSALCGTRDHVAVARRLRKALGGGWRQAGILAAAALHALDHHVDRLAEDHAHARVIADAVRSCESLRLEPDYGGTNIVIFRVEPRLGAAAEFCDRLKQTGIRLSPFAKQKVRAVTHLDVTAEEATEAAERLVEAASG